VSALRPLSLPKGSNRSRTLADTALAAPSEPEDSLLTTPQRGSAGHMVHETHRQAGFVTVAGNLLAGQHKQKNLQSNQGATIIFK